MTVAGVFLACASAPPDWKNTDQLAFALRARGVEPSQLIIPYAVTEEMRQWALAATRGATGPHDRLVRLQRRLVSGKLRLRYRTDPTGTAAEAFRQREANCLAFAYLFVGMARSIGLPVYFVVVGEIEDYRQMGSLRVASDHIAVGHGAVWRRQIIDFGESYRDDHRVLHEISDLKAIAMFYSNRGVEQLQAGHVAEAVRWLETAVGIEPGLATAWVNLGVARRHRGDPSGAESAYRQSLAKDPNTLSAYRNLASLLRLQGRSTEAAAFEQELASRPSSGPR